MKKIFCITLFVLVLFSFKLEDVHAHQGHLAFQEMNIYGGKLIRNYTDEELEPYYEETKSPHFAKWQIAYINEGTLAHFKSHTVFSYYNTGTTPIEYKYTYVLTKSHKVSFDVTGDIGLKVSGGKSSFKGGLDTSLKIKYSDTTEEVEKETIQMEFKCDANTRVIMYEQGEGYLYNGISRNYLLWFCVEKGGFEYFVTSTTYQVLEKVAI